MFGNSNREIYNTMCKIDSQWEFAVRLQRGAEGTANQTGALQQAKGRMGNKMGRRSRREGTWVYLWLILIDV